MFFEMAEKNFAEALYLIGYVGEINEDKIKNIILVLQQTRFGGSNLDIDTQVKIKKGILTKEEVNEYNEQNKTFCHKGDFDLIYALFLEKYQINLIELDINWFEYLFLLENILLEENALTKRISYRNFKPQKGKGMESYNSSNLELRSKYSYREEE